MEAVGVNDRHENEPDTGNSTADQSDNRDGTLRCRSLRAIDVGPASNVNCSKDSGSIGDGGNDAASDEGRFHQAMGADI